MIATCVGLLALSAATPSVSIDSDPALEGAVVDRVRAEVASGGYRIIASGEAATARVHLAREPGLLFVLVEVPEANRRAERKIVLASGETLSLSHAATEAVDVLRATLLESKLGAPKVEAVAELAERSSAADAAPASTAPNAPWLGLQLDEGVAFAVSQPQRGYFDPGDHTRLTGLLEVAPFMDVEAAGSLAVLPNRATSPFARPVAAYGLEGGARFHRPFAGARVIPSASARLGWSLSGVSSLSLTGAAGVQFRLSGESPLLVGPMVRFDRLVALGQLPDRENHDASLLSAGLTVEFRPGAAAPRDSDGDGVPDDRDRCPAMAGDDDRGCPGEPKALADSDGDGVPDDRDECPTVAGEDSRGCPARPRVVDADGDGVPDAVDECPHEKGPATAQGCPDADGDGVPDKADACPTVAGKKEDAGCPTYKEVVVTSTRLELKQKIFFAFGTTIILPKSHSLLIEVARALEDHAALCVRVEGHTDAVGSADANLRLSQGRTQAVRDYLVTQGLSAGRLTAVGYGSSLPLDDNRTPEGRENNRRVEFVIVPCEGKE